MKNRRYIDDPNLPELPLFKQGASREEQIHDMVDFVEGFKAPMTGATHPDTSREAAKIAGRTAKTLRANVHRYIKSMGESGATANEVHLHFNLDKNSTSPRITELKQAGLIFDSGVRRSGEGCGKSIVWKAEI